MLGDFWTPHMCLNIDRANKIRAKHLTAEQKTTKINLHKTKIKTKSKTGLKIGKSNIR